MRISEGRDRDRQAQCLRLARLGPRPGEELTLHGRAQHHYPYVIEVESPGGVRAVGPTVRAEWIESNT